MANLNESDEWFAGIYQLEEDDPVLGGPAGIDNLAPRQLASRSLFQRLRNVTPWSALLAYPAGVAFVGHAGTTWKSVAASTGVEPGTDTGKWVRWAHTEAELAQLLGDAVAGHEAKPNPHPQYATDDDLAAHIAAPDPHTGYVPWAFAAAMATAAGLVPDRSTPGQLAQAVPLLAPGRLLAVRVFKTPGTFTYNETPGTKWIVAEGVGGGGAGGGTPAVPGASSIALGGGGSAGAFARGIFLTGFSGAALTVGAAGVGAVGAGGTAGGTSSLGALMSCPGGVPSSLANVLTPTAPVRDGGTQPSSAPSGGNLVAARGQAGEFGMFLSTGIHFNAGQGGSSFYGSGGGRVIAQGNGLAGPSPGSGGSGALTSGGGAAFAGGNGGTGQWIIWEFS